MNRVLIIGASRGIGLGLVDVHLDAGWTVHATTRDGSAPRDHPDLLAHRLDVRDEEQLEALIGDLEDPLDRIIHNAGIKDAPFDELIRVNVDSAIRVVDRLLDSGCLQSGGTVALMSSRMGSRGGRVGRLGHYGESKALLNERFRALEPRWREAGAIAVALHPGWVRTDMGGRSAPLSVPESARGLMRLLDELDTSDHGRFLNWDGAEIPW